MTGPRWPPSVIACAAATLSRPSPAPGRNAPDLTGDWVEPLAAASGAAAWLYLLLGRGRFWDVRLPQIPHISGSASVVAVIPARDEAASIGRTVSSLLAQRFAGSLHIVLVDDHSSDGTAEHAREAAEAAGGADRLTVIAANALPAGWTGKLSAVAKGVAHARTMRPDFLLLTDADIEHDPDNLAGLLALAEAERRDLVSQMVLLSTASLPERALIPAFVFFFFMLYPPRWTADPGNASAGAAGGCILIRPAMLERIGGIASIRGALIDDCALAAAVKRAGGRIRLDATRRARSIRVYEKAADIWAMIARTAFTQLRYSALLLAGTLVGLALTYMAAPLLAIFGEGWPRLIGAAVWLAMAAAFLPVIRLYRLNPLWSLTLPAIAVFYAAATIGSAVDFWRGRGGRWKGRAQAIS